MAVPPGVVSPAAVYPLPVRADDPERPKVDLDRFAEMEDHLARCDLDDGGLRGARGLELGMCARGPSGSYQDQQHYATAAEEAPQVPHSVPTWTWSDGRRPTNASARGPGTRLRKGVHDPATNRGRVQSRAQECAGPVDSWWTGRASTRLTIPAHLDARLPGRRARRRSAGRAAPRSAPTRRRRGSWPAPSGCRRLPT